MPAWAATLIAALFTAAAAIFYNSFQAGKVTGTIETNISAVRSDVAQVRADNRDSLKTLETNINNRFDTMEKSQGRQWAVIDGHTKDIGRLEGKVEILKSLNPRAKTEGTEV